MIEPRLRVLPDAPAIARKAADRIVAAADEAIELFGRFSLVLAGGSTPKLLYRVLSSDEYTDQINWSKVDIFFGDERCVPPDHPDSNYKMAAETLLKRVPLPGDNIYRMRGEIDPNEAAIEYGKMLKERFDDLGPDFTLLGMGDDGHTASLFPHTEALNETRHRCVAHFVKNSTTGESWRITLTAPFLNRSREIFVMVAGAGKARAVTQVFEGPREPQKFPIQLIQPESGKITWLLDIAAAGMDAE